MQATPERENYVTSPSASLELGGIFTLIEYSLTLLDPWPIMKVFRHLEEILKPECPLTKV